MSDSPEVHASQGELGSSHPFIDNLAELTLWDDEEAIATEYHYSQASLPRHTLRIKDLPSEERPRDRLVTSGVKSLSTGELLSILLCTGQGSGKLSAVGLGQHILQVLSEDQRDPMERLRDISVQELVKISGVGPAKAATILAAIELGKRVFLSRPPERTLIDDPATAAAVLTDDLMWQSQERFAVLLLDVKNRLMGSRVIAIGTATETVVHPREIFREAIRQGATRIIVGHNHPSGNVEPSTQDIVLTQHLLQVGQLLSIPVLIT